MTARSTLTQIHSKLFALLTGLLLLAAVVVADTPVATRSSTPKFFSSNGAADVHTPAVDEHLLSVADEFHPEVGIGPHPKGKGFALDIDLVVSLPGLDRAEAEALVAEAHEVCPYSNATRGNVDVRLSIA